MASDAVEDVRAARRSALRRATLQLVLGVAVLDTLALAVYFVGGIEHAAGRTRQIFTVVWLVATVLVVAVLLKRVRAIRFAR